MKITFHGAAQNVTGSKHIVSTADKQILLDCGLFQGRRSLAYELNSRLPFDPSSLDAAILSHAHADHCGLIPLLVKNGFSNKIYATPATADISRLIMLDSAKLQTEDFRHLTEQGEKPLPPLYDEQDVENACSHFEETVYFRTLSQWTALSPNLRFKFYDAGHILGSAVTVIESDEREGKKRLLFTGDLGNPHVPILHDPEPITEPIDAIITECTYGDRNHKPIGDAEKVIEEIVNDAVRNKKKIIVPAFALGRTQQLIYTLHLLHNQGKIPAFPIYIDSPLSNKITEVFRKYDNDFDTEAWRDFLSHNESPFSFDMLKYVSSPAESKALNKLEGPFMVIASSGMAEGGRILHHLEHHIWDERSIVILTGFQAEHTLGRKLQEGATHVSVYGRSHEVKARIVTINEFSAHADQTALLGYITALTGLKKVFLVHCEPGPAEAFQRVLSERAPALEIIIPKTRESYIL